MIGIEKFFAFLKAKLSKASGEVFRWWRRKRRALTGATIMLLLGAGLGIWLSQRQPGLWPQARDVFTKTAAWSNTTFARLWRGPAKGIIPSESPVTSSFTPQPPVVRPARLDLGTSRADANGTLEGSNLGITEVTATETPDPDAETKLTLRIGVKKQPNTQIDNTKVKIQVYFYDTVDDKDVKLTDADVTYEWLTPNHDWPGSDPEMLAVTYTRPKSNVLSPETALFAAAAAVNPGNKSRARKRSPAMVGESGRREYLGYIVRVYYDDQLQAVRADPTRLLKLFPPSPTAFPWFVADSSRRELVTSPYATSADFAKYAMRLREAALVEIEPQVFEPTSSHPATQRFPWKTNIVTTVFWIGGEANSKSVWDANWTSNYGGFDNPDSSARHNHIPVGFIPRQNPFYCALPYNDVTHGQFKPEAPLVIPWFKQAYAGPGRSVCQHRWISIRKRNRTCYAQWEDCGPFRTDHFQYVFQNERPKPNASHGAGLSVSPSVRNYLGLAPTDVTDWQFVEVPDVPPGPWRS